MYAIVEKMTEELGLTLEQTEGVFTAVINQLLTKVPELARLIDNVFTEAESEKLNYEVNKVIFLFQQRKMKAFVGWTMPQETKQIYTKKDDILW